MCHNLLLCGTLTFCNILFFSPLCSFVVHCNACRNFAPNAQRQSVSQSVRFKVTSPHSRRPDISRGAFAHSSLARLVAAGGENSDKLSNALPPTVCVCVIALRARDPDTKRFVCTCAFTTASRLHLIADDILQLSILDCRLCAARCPPSAALRRHVHPTFPAAPQ